MLFAQRTKKYTALLLLTLAALLLLALPALAEDAIGMTLSVEPDSLTEPGPVTVSIRVVNNSGADLSEPVTLYDPDGQVVTSFGDGGQALLQQGDYRTAQQTYNVSQAQLNEGKLSYTLSYNEVDAGGNVTVQSIMKSVDIAYTGTNVDLTVSRSISPEVVRNGSTVTVQYELYNAGNVEVKNIRVRESSTLNVKDQTLSSLAPGERTTIKFTATMARTDLTSEGRVTYRAGEDSRTVTLPAITIPRANPGLELNDILSADSTAITGGDTVTLTLTIKNNGNITYSNISVTDAKYGELFTNLTLGPGETLIKDKQFTLSETTTFKYTITLPDNTGTTTTVSSNEVKVSVYDPSQVMLLSVNAVAESNSVASVPADMRFTITVTNNTSSEAKNISLYHGSTRFYTIDSLAPSESYSVTPEFTLSQAGKYRFTARVTDALQNVVSFESNEIIISLVPPTAAPTMAPVVTIAPLVTVTTAPIEVLEPVTLQTNRVLRIAALVLAILFACCFVLFIISTVMRAKRRSASNSAYDHMELVGSRDYTEPGQNVSAVEAAQAREAASKPSDDILNQSAAPAAPTAAAATDDNGGYRLVRNGDVAAPAANDAAPAQTTRREEPNEDE